MVPKIDPGTAASAPQNSTAAALKCPRCDSTNTKFCYFNNYSLSQPRHFCKSCKRYWTLGGTLRNVPVGGGCRKNKRHKKPPLKITPNPLPSLPPPPSIHPPAEISSLHYGFFPLQSPSPGFLHPASSSHRSLFNPQISPPLMCYDQWEISKEESLEAFNSFAAATADSSYLYWNQIGAGAGSSWPEPGFSVAPPL